ncbi:MAG: hypothetical protein M3Z25_14490 [Actinomycetota bacterium]|nr:hypothetical protein [Actinomycetota bacterium]
MTHALRRPAGYRQNSFDPPVSVLEHAAVRVLWDAGDTDECVTALNARHDLGTGVVVCHPSPATTSTAVLGEDILVALGKRPGGPAAEGLNGRRWELARWWLAGERVQHLVMLRAHLLPAPLWHSLAELTAATATTLWLVVHQPGLHAEHRAALEPHGYPGAFSVRPWWATLNGLPEPAPVRSGFPTVPDVEFPLFRATARRVLDPDDFARVDQTYRATFLAAREEAQRWNRSGGKPITVGPGEAAALLQRHTISAASQDEFRTRVRALQAGLFTAGLLLQLHLWSRKHPYALGLGLRLENSTVTRLRGLCSPPVAAALTLHRTLGLEVRTLHSLRLRDVLDAGADVMVTAAHHHYRVPGRAAGAVRATVMQRHAQLATSDSEATWLFTGQSGGPTTKACLQRRIDRAAAYSGVIQATPKLRDLRIVDLHEAP